MQIISSIGVALYPKTQPLQNFLRPQTISQQLQLCRKINWLVVSLFEILSNSPPDFFACSIVCCLSRVISCLTMLACRLYQFGWLSVAKQPITLVIDWCRRINEGADETGRRCQVLSKGGEEEGCRYGRRGTVFHNAAVVPTRVSQPRRIDWYRPTGNHRDAMVLRPGTQTT